MNDRSADEAFIAYQSQSHSVYEYILKRLIRLLLIPHGILPFLLIVLHCLPGEKPATDGRFSR